MHGTHHIELIILKARLCPQFCAQTCNIGGSCLRMLVQRAAEAEIMICTWQFVIHIKVLLFSIDDQDGHQFNELIIE